MITLRSDNWISDLEEVEGQTNEKLTEKLSTNKNYWKSFCGKQVVEWPKGQTNEKFTETLSTSENY